MCMNFVMLVLQEEALHGCFRGYIKGAEEMAVPCGLL